MNKALQGTGEWKAEWSETDVSLEIACGPFPARLEDYNFFLWTGFIGQVGKSTPQWPAISPSSSLTRVMINHKYDVRRDAGGPKSQQSQT